MKYSSSHAKGDKVSVPLGSLFTGNGRGVKVVAVPVGVGLTGAFVFLEEETTFIDNWSLVNLHSVNILVDSYFCLRFFVDSTCLILNSWLLPNVVPIFLEVVVTSQDSKEAISSV